MRIIITCILKIDPDQRDEALSSMVGLIKKASEEPGCLAYTWAADIVEKDTIHVFEYWNSEASLASHFKASSFFEIPKHLAKRGLRGAEAKKYAVGKESALYDAEGNVTVKFL